MVVKRFLTREIKVDTKGLYFNYGPYRLRPTSKRTIFDKGNLILMLELYHHKDYLEMVVFNDVERYEIWKTKS